MVVRTIRRGETIYGVTTGFGEFSNVKISPADLEQLQENLIMSHAAGTGEALRTFNLGVGLVIIVSKRGANTVTELLREAGEKPFLIGEVGQR